MNFTTLYDRMSSSLSVRDRCNLDGGFAQNARVSADLVNREETSISTAFVRDDVYRHDLRPSRGNGTFSAVLFCL